MEILLGLGLSDDVLENVINSLINLGIDINTHEKIDNVRTKDAVIKVLSDDKCKYNVAIVAQALQISKPFTVKDFDYIRTENENVLIMPVISDTYKGTEYMQGLDSLGITGAVFEKDADMKTIADIIRNNGRSKKIARIYYGIEGVDNYQTGNANISGNDTSPSEIGSSTNINDYKQDTRNVNFSSVENLIAVIGLTREAGSTIVSLNLSAQLAKLGNEVSLIQLPNTESDLYDNLRFAKEFSTDYVSHISDIASNNVMSSTNNKYQCINFIVPNPYTDIWIDDIWGNEQTFRLLLQTGGIKILDCGSYYESDGVFDCLMYCKHILVVIDASYMISEEDFEVIKQIRSQAADIKILFVINKCGSDCSYIDKFIKNESVLKIPVVGNEKFEKVGSDILVTAGNTGFEKLSELIGYGKVSIDNAAPSLKPKKKRIALDTRKSVRKKVNMTTVEIGVGGVVRGVGVTHTALMIGYVLSKNYRVAIVEQNQPYDNARSGTEHAFANIYRMLYPDTYINSNVIPKFRYKGMDFFPYCNYTQFSARFRDEYDFVIVDFGDEMIDSNFFRMGKRIVVASGADWKLFELKRYVSEVAVKNSLENSINYLIPFIPNGKLGQIRKICQASGAMPSVYSVPMCPDWDNPTEEIEIMVNDILSNNTVKRKGIKKAASIFNRK